MRKVLLIIIVVFTVISLDAQNNARKPVNSDSKVIEHGLNNKGETVVIKRGSLTPSDQTKQAKKRKDLALESKKLKSSPNAQLAKGTSPNLSNGTPYPSHSIDEQIKSIEQEIDLQKNASKSDSKLRLQKLEQLLEQKKLEKVIGQ